MFFMKRCRLFVYLLAGLFACWATVTCSNAPPGLQASDEETVTIVVSAAASLQDALEAIAPQFHEAHPEITADYNFGSSGALQQQIEQGAPVDIFFSAASQQMDALAAKGSILPDIRRDVVANRLVAIVPTNSSLQLADLAELKEISIDRFAVGEFRSVPAGQYAKQVFERLELLAPLQSKFVFGNNVRGVLAAVESGNVDLGMVYATDAALSNRVKVLATVPEDLHPPIRYPIAVLQSSVHPEAAERFIDFLQEDPAQKLFADFGFVPLAPDT